MKLINLFDNLKIPKNEKYYIGEKINSEFNHQIAKDYKGRPVFLIKTSGFSENQDPINLEKLSLKHSQNVIIENDSNKTKSTYSILHFLDEEKSYHLYFLDQISALNECLKKETTKLELENHILSIIELWRNIKIPLESKIRGLWGELLIINSSTNKNELLKAWHSKYNDKYDFYDHNEAIEVKTTISNERIHHFSYNQINNPKEKLIIASILIQENINGKSLNDLKKEIENNIDEPDLKNKLTNNFHQAIGATKNIEKFKYDYQYSIRNILYYNQSELPKFNNIPNEIKNIEFDLNLSRISNINNFNEFTLFKFLNIN